MRFGYESEAFPILFVQKILPTAFVLTNAILFQFKSPRKPRSFGWFPFQSSSTDDLEKVIPLKQEASGKVLHEGRTFAATGELCSL